MSWSVTVDNLQSYPDQLPASIVEDMLTQHIRYGEDMHMALRLAKAAGFSSATLSGFRTPNPYGGDEVAAITVIGHAKATNFNKEMKRIIDAGPDSPCPHEWIPAEPPYESDEPYPYQQCVRCGVEVKIGS